MSAVVAFLAEKVDLWFIELFGDDDLVLLLVLFFTARAPSTKFQAKSPVLFRLATRAARNTGLSFSFYDLEVLASVFVLVLDLVVAFAVAFAPRTP